MRRHAPSSPGRPDLAPILRLWAKPLMLSTHSHQKFCPQPRVSRSSRRILTTLKPREETAKVASSKVLPTTATQLYDPAGSGAREADFHTTSFVAWHARGRIRRQRSRLRRRVRVSCQIDHVLSRENAHYSYSVRWWRDAGVARRLISNCVLTRAPSLLI